MSLSFFSHGQMGIKIDTIAVECAKIYRITKDAFFITTQREYENSEFFTGSDNGCLPFSDIDFDTSILVGYKYQGSNCDTSIQWSRIIYNGDDYLIQFATSPNHVCRDLQYRLVWFVLDKPAKRVDVSFERVINKNEN